MHLPRRCAARLYAIAIFVAAALPGFADRWEDDPTQLSMDVPTGWREFQPSLLESANKQVRHVTGRSFIAGHALSVTAGTDLVFPYLLIQYKPYADLPEAGRPAAKLGMAGKLELLTRVVDVMRPAEGLAESITAEAFARQRDNEQLRLLGMSDDGRFDLAGTIPAADDSSPIRYHTHGVFGRAGVAMVTVFGAEQFDAMGPVIQGPLRTLSFSEGHAYADLPETAPPPADPDQGDPLERASDESSAPESASADPQSPTQTEDRSDPSPQDAPAESPGSADDPAEDQPDSGALVLILVVMGVVMLVVVAIVVFVTHQQTQARRERAQARRERLEQRG